MNSDFKELLNILNEEKAKYLIVGGYAVIEHTEPRYTKDLDIWISYDLKNAEKVFRALKKFGAPLANIKVEDFTVPSLVYQMGRPPARIDVIMSVKELDFETSWQNKVESKYDDVTVYFLSLEDLLKNKESVGRPQDLIDASNLRLAQILKNKSK